MKECLPLLRDAIQLSTHVLTHDPSQIAGQLSGRLLSIDSPDIQDFLKRVGGAKSSPWLRPLNPALSQVGGPLVCTLTGHLSGVNCVAVTPDGQIAVSGSGSPWGGVRPALKIWNLNIKQKVVSLEGSYVGFSSVAITTDGKCTVTGCFDRTVRVWDLEKGNLVHSLEGHPGEVRDVAVIPDGRRAVSCCEEVLKGENLILWDIEQGRKIHGLCFADEKGVRQQEKRDGLRRGTLSSPLDIHCISVTPDGRFAVFGWSGVRKGWAVWDLKRNKISRVVLIWGGINAVATLPDGQHIITASGGSMQIWRLKSGKEKSRLKEHSTWKPGQTSKTAGEDDIRKIAITSDGRKAVTASADRTLKLWDLERGVEVTNLIGHSEPVNSVALSEDGYRAVSGSSDRTVKVWDLRRAKAPEVPIGHLSSVNALSITPDGRFLVSGSHDRTVKVWNLEKRQEIHTLKGHRGAVLAVAVTPDSRYAVSGADLNDRTLRLWDLAKGEQAGCLKIVDDSITALAVTRDGRYAVYGLGAGIVHVDGYKLSIPQTIKRWDLSEREGEDRGVYGSPIYDVMDEPDPMERKAIQALAVMPDCRRVITGSNDKFLKIWDLKTGTWLHTLSGHERSVNSVAVTQDGRYAVSGSADGTVRTWDLIKNKPVLVLAGHTEGVFCVAFTPDSRRLVSVSDDASLRVWDMASGELLTSFTGEGGLMSCAVAPDGKTIVAGDVAGHLIFLHLH
jgi:WD40 repeat protein